MKILHLFANSKWTGPAEPALNLATALRDFHGIDTEFFCAPHSGASVNKVLEEARARGFNPPANLHLDKHHHLLHNWHDRRTLRRILRATRYDALHCHLDNDHRIAAAVAPEFGIPIIRSSYEGLGFRGRGYAKMLANTALLLEPSQRALDHDQQRFNLDPSRLAVVPGAIDVHRFDPARLTIDGKSRAGLPHDSFVIGIVARMQTHRHFEDLFLAFRRLLDERPKVQLVVIGRGTNQDKVGWQAVDRHNLAGHVYFTGYIEGDEYAEMLGALDIGVYMVPGSDGTCRAVREIMAMAKPMVVANRGMLPEIVTHGVDGLVFDNSVTDLHESLRRLHDDTAERTAMGWAARDKALTHYSLEAQSLQVANLYRNLLPS